MEIKGLLQVFGRLWLMEETQARYWADIARQVLITKSMSAIPSMDPRTIGGVRQAYAGLAYDDIFRVDENANMNPEGPVQVIRLNGPLMEEDYCGSAGMSTMQQAVRAAAKDPSIKSLVLFNNSPGGTVAGTQNLAREIKSSFQGRSVSFVKNMMCSADYWIGSSADEIIVDDETGGYNTLIGSIGTKAMIMDNSEQMDMQGVKVISVASPDSPRKGKYTEDILSGDYTRLKEELKAINSFFIAGVKQNRGDKLKLDSENVLDGEVYYAKDAIKYGLADRFGSFDYAVKRSLQLAKTIRA